MFCCLHNGQIATQIRQRLVGDSNLTYWWKEIQFHLFYWLLKLHFYISSDVCGHKSMKKKEEQQYKVNYCVNQVLFNRSSSNNDLVISADIQKIKMLSFIEIIILCLVLKQFIVSSLKVSGKQNLIHQKSRNQNLWQQRPNK